MDGDDVVKEKDVPDRFNDSRDEAGKPQRELHNFTVTQLPADDDEDDDLVAVARGKKAMVSICAIDDSVARGGRKTQPIVARGTLKATDGSGVEVVVETGRLNEWCIDYGLLTIWVETDLSWYKMSVPTKSYEKTHDLARRRMEICSRLYVLSNEFAPLGYAAALGYMAHPYLHMKGYVEKEITNEKRFVLEQAEQIGDEVFKSSPFLKELRKKPGGSDESRRKSSSGSAGSDEKKKSGGSSARQSKSKKSSAASEPAVTWAPGRTENGTSASQIHMLKRIDGILAKLVKDKRALMFGEPVDPVRHGCANYFDIVKNPMDLGTVQTKLTRKHYVTVEEAMNDIRLVWSNCRLFNPGDSQLVKFADDLERKVDRQVYNAETAEIASAAKRAAAAPKAPPATSTAKTAAVGSAKGARVTSPSQSGSANVDGHQEQGALKRKRSASTSATPIGSPAANATPSSASKPPIPPGAGNGTGSPKKQVKVPQPQPADFKGSGKPCSAPRCTDREARLGSKYCSDECGLEVAAARLQSMTDRGIPIPDFIKAM